VAASHVKTFEGASEPLFREYVRFRHTDTRQATPITFSKTEAKKLVFMGRHDPTPPTPQLDDPDITIEFDVDQKAGGGDESDGPFADAARNGYFVALDHMYFPGIGRLRKE